MKNFLAKRREKKVEEVSIIWNTEVFQGMTRTQILEFKKTHKKLILEQYKLNKKREVLELKQTSLNKKVAKARREILALETEKENKATGKAVKVALGGIFIATVVASSQMSAMETNHTYTTTNDVVVEQSVEYSTDNVDMEVAVENKECSVEQNILEEVQQVVEVQDVEVQDVMVEKDNIISVEQFVDTEEAEVNVENIVEEETSDVEGVIMDSSTIEVPMDNVVIENDFIIFDEALEMGIEMCENTFNGTIMSKKFSVLDIIEEANNPIVDKWFQMLLDTNINHKTIECNVSYIAPIGAVSFNSRGGDFFADIDKSQVEVRVDVNLQKMINDSIESGVDEFTRDLLFNNEYREIESIFMKLQLQVEDELVKSGAFLEEVKNDIASKLTKHTTWDVYANLK